MGNNRGIFGRIGAGVIGTDEAAERGAYSQHLEEIARHHRLLDAWCIRTAPEAAPSWRGIRDNGSEAPGILLQGHNLREHQRVVERPLPRGVADPPDIQRVDVPRIGDLWRWPEQQPIDDG